MRKRLRKKLRLGEFRENCFEITFQIDPSLDEKIVDTRIDNFIEMIESHDLQFGGGGQVRVVRRGPRVVPIAKPFLRGFEATPAFKRQTRGRFVTTGTAERSEFVMLTKPIEDRLHKSCTSLDQ